MSLLKLIPTTLLLLLLTYTQQQGVTWSPLPSVRTGQINSIMSLATSSDNDTETTITYDTALPQNSNLQYGLSLISYNSWMTNTFSFNISLVSLSNTSITISFAVLDNTYFTTAKVHYIVVWRPGTNTNTNLPASPPSDPQTYNNIQSIFGCYLTFSLLTGTGNRSMQVGGQQNSSIYGTNTTADLVYYSMIAGMQLTNSQGYNNFVEVQPYFTGNQLYYNVTVQNNNFLYFICITTVVVDPSVNIYYQMSIIEYQTISLTATNAGLGTVSYAQRFDGTNRLFFGISQFNLSMSNTRYLNVQTSNISFVAQYYQINAALNQDIYNLFFFAFRTCTNDSQYYYPLNYSCLDSCPDNAIPTPPILTNATYLLCDPCHYSCSTCAQGQNPTQCLTCDPTHYRTIGVGTCACNTGYADIGNPACVVCSLAMPGCVYCTSSTYCTSCNNITFIMDNITFTHQCICKPDYYYASGYCLDYSGCMTAVSFNNTIACTVCNTALNYIMVESNSSCICNSGYFLNTSVPECYFTCGDNITAAGHCADGNLVDGDGCDSSCDVQNGYHCTTLYQLSGQPGLSKCVMITTVTVNYLYAERIINTNDFIMAFNITPAESTLTSTSFNSTNFATSLPIQNQEITFDPSTSTIFLQGEYLYSIEGTSFSVNVIFTNNEDFYAEPVSAQFTAVGINAKLVINSMATYNTALQYIYLGQGILAVLLAIFASVVGLKLVGIELLIPVQLIYYSLAAVGTQSSYQSTMSSLKYVNGYSNIVNYNYFRTYTQNQNLVAINYQTQYLLSINIMLGIYVLILFWLLFHHIKIKYKEDQLEAFLNQQAALQEEEAPQKKEVHSDQSEDKEDPDQDQEKQKLRRSRQPKNEQALYLQNELREQHHYMQKIFSFQVDRVYFIFYLILFDQMLFGFIVMALNLPIASFHFSEQLSILICFFLTFIFIGNIVFIHHDQTSNKMISFTCIHQRYAYIYLFLNLAIIFILSFTFTQEICIQIITALSSFYVVLVLVERPYNKTLIQFENLVALYLSLMFVVCEILLCIVNTTTLTQNFQVIVAILMAALIMIGQILTVIRILLKVNFKKAFDDLKNPLNDRDRDEKKKNRIKQKNLDLLGKDSAQIRPPDSVRNGLFTPKDQMINWQARNTEEYQSAQLRKAHHEALNPDAEQENPNTHENEENSENKDTKLNELELLKKRLRNNLRQKRQLESKKAD